MVRRLSPHVWLFLVTSACLFPTDRSIDLRVEFVTPASRLVLGDTLKLEARIIDAAGASVPNAHLRFVSDDPAVAVVDRSGTVRPFGRGVTQIRARVIEFEDARPDSLTVTVVPQLRVTSIQPVPARFGDRLQVMGFGLDPTFLTAVTIGGQDVNSESFTPLDPNDPSTSDTLTLVVPALAPLASKVVIERFDVTATQTIVVEQRDVFEPNDHTPAPLASGFHNTSLTLEPEAPVDWYRIPVASAEPVTIAVTTRVAPQPFDVTVSSRRAQVDATPSWAVSPQGRGVVCRGVRFDAPAPLSHSTVKVALAPVAGDTIDLVIATNESFSDPIPYELAVAAEYSSDSPPDDLEENDFCDAAPELALSVRHAMTFDTPGDLDWVRVTVDSLQPFVFEVLAPLDSTGIADPNLYLFQHTTGLPLLDSAVGGGAKETLARTLGPGVYLLLAWNGAGKAADYVLQAYAGELGSPPLKQISAGWNRTCALTVFGEALCWGNGPLGDGTVENSETPVAVVGGGASNLQFISAGRDHTCAFNPDSGFCWGRNESGQVGNGTTTEAVVPSRLSSFAPIDRPATLTQVLSVHAGWAHTCAVATAQEIQRGGGVRVIACWGRAAEGQLGPDFVDPVLIPAEMRSGGFPVGRVPLIAAADSAHSCFLGPGLWRLSTNIVCVGDTTWGQIGPVNTDVAGGSGGTIGSLPFDSAAVVVAGGNGQGAHACAIDRTDATWCWGSNRFGQLGDPTVTGSTADPVRVAGGIVFATITAGGLHTCGLTVQGDAFCWGDNSVGQIGDGTTTQAGVPVAVTGGLTFTSLSAGNYHTCGVSMDGVGYCWGSGPLGVAGVTSSVVPIQISSR